jgi:hypothetical protein
MMNVSRGKTGYVRGDLISPILVICEEDLRGIGTCGQSMQ